MTYINWLQTYIGSEVEVAVTGDIIVGTLNNVDTAYLTVNVPPVVYGPPTDTATIPLSAIHFVRIVSS